MFKNRLLKALLAPFFAFIDDPDNGGGKVDRGDDWTPPGDDDDAAAKAAAEAAAKEAEEKAAAEKAAADAAAAKEEEGKGEGEKEDKDEKGKKKDTRIPLSRHEEILKKERERREAAEAELAKSRKQEVAVQSDKFLQESETKLQTLEEQYNSAIVDGKTAEASKLMRDIRALERQIGDHKVEIRAEAAREAAVEAVRYDAIVDRIEAAYPQMTPGTTEYDKDKVAEVLELKEAYELKGYKPSAALQKAVKYVLGAETKKQETATEVTPRADDDEVAKKLKQERAAEATKKAVDAAQKTPPSTAKAGVDSDKLGGTLDAKAIMKMNQDEFAKLDEATLARMRGDTV